MWVVWIVLLGKDRLFFLTFDPRILAPNNKSQISNKIQIINSQYLNSGNLGFGACLLFAYCDL